MKYLTALQVQSLVQAHRNVLKVIQKYLWVQAQRVDLRILMMKKILERGKLVTLQGFLSRWAFVRKEVNTTYN